MIATKIESEFSGFLRSTLILFSTLFSSDQADFFWCSVCTTYISKILNLKLSVSEMDLIATLSKPVFSSTRK